MMRQFLIAAACASVALTATTTLATDSRMQTHWSNEAEIEVAQACGWYIFTGCSRSYEGALRHAGNGLEILRTSNYRLLNPGWYCAAVGPYPKKPSNWEVRQVRRHVPDAYAKRAC